MRRRRGRMEYAAARGAACSTMVGRLWVRCGPWAIRVFLYVPMPMCTCSVYSGCCGTAVRVGTASVCCTVFRIGTVVLYGGRQTHKVSKFVGFQGDLEGFRICLQLVRVGISYVLTVGTRRAPARVRIRIGLARVSCLYRRRVPTCIFVWAYGCSALAVP